MNKNFLISCWQIIPKYNNKYNQKEVEKGLFNKHSSSFKNGDIFIENLITSNLYFLKHLDQKNQSISICLVGWHP